MEDDATLFGAWCRGDAGAGAVLFDRHYEAIARYFHNKVDAAAGPDLIQSTFLACVEARERFRGDASFRTFLFAVARNLLRKHYETSRVAAERLDYGVITAHDLAPSASELLRAREEQRLLLAALRQIPVECQEVLELHYWERLGTADIARVIEVPIGTVKSRLQRARRLLEERLTTLAASPALLHSTLATLDAWAADLRDRLGGPRVQAGGA